MYSCFTVLCWFLLYSKVNQPYVYTYPLFFGFLFHLGHHRALSRVTCAIQLSSVALSCLTLCDPMDCSTPGFPVLHQGWLSAGECVCVCVCTLLELAQTHVHRVGDAIQLSHPLSSPAHPAFNLYSIRVFQQVSSLHQVAKLLELQLQHQSFQWISRVDFLLDWLVWSSSVQGTLKSLF